MFRGSQIGITLSNELDNTESEAETSRLDKTFDEMSKSLEILNTKASEHVDLIYKRITDIGQ
jgi:hypothetical protein